MKDFSVLIFADTVKVMVLYLELFIELDVSVLLLVTLAIFQGRMNVGQF